MTDAYHRGNLQLSQVGTFTYILPLVPYDDLIPICINLVLQMGWVGSPKFFCAFSETLTDVTNDLVDADLPVPDYGAISALLATDPWGGRTPSSLTHIDCYMDDVISVVQGGEQSDNTKSSAAPSVLSNGFSLCYPGKLRTQCQSRSSWPEREIGSASRSSLGGSSTLRRER